MEIIVSLVFFILIVASYCAWFLFVLCTASYNNIKNTGLQNMFYTFIVHSIHLFISVLTIIISGPWSMSVPVSVWDSKYGCHLLARSKLINSSLHVFLLSLFGYVKVSIPLKATETNMHGTMMFIKHAIHCTLYLWTLVIFGKGIFVPTGSYATDSGMRTCVKIALLLKVFWGVEISLFIFATVMICYLYTLVEVAVDNDLHLHSTLKFDKRIIPSKFFLTIIVFMILAIMQKTGPQQMDVFTRFCFANSVILDEMMNNILMYYCIYGRNIEYFASTDEDNDSEFSETFSISPPVICRQSPPLVIVNTSVVYDLPQPRINVSPNEVQINAPTEQNPNYSGGFYTFPPSPSSRPGSSLFISSSSQRINVTVVQPKVWICLPSAHPIKVSVSVVNNNRLHPYVITDRQQLAKIERYANLGYVRSLRRHCSSTPELMDELQQMRINQQNITFME